MVSRRLPSPFQRDDGLRVLVPGEAVFAGAYSPGPCRSSVRRRVRFSLLARPELGAGPKSIFPFSNRKRRFCSVPT